MDLAQAGCLYYVTGQLSGEATPGVGHAHLAI